MRRADEQLYDAETARSGRHIGDCRYRRQDLEANAAPAPGYRASVLMW